LQTIQVLVYALVIILIKIMWLLLN